MINSLKVCLSLIDPFSFLKVMVAIIGVVRLLQIFIKEYICSSYYSRFKSVRHLHLSYKATNIKSWVSHAAFFKIYYCYDIETIFFESVGKILRRALLNFIDVAISSSKE